MRSIVDSVVSLILLPGSLKQPIKEETTVPEQAETAPVVPEETMAALQSHAEFHVRHALLAAIDIAFA